MEPVGGSLVVGVGPSQCSFCTHSPHTGLFIHRDVPAGLRGGFLLPGSEEIQDAATPRAGGLTDRPVRIPPVPAG